MTETIIESADLKQEQYKQCNRLQAYKQAMEGYQDYLNQQNQKNGGIKK